MKKLLLLSSGILFMTAVNAQTLPTQDFESWITTTGAQQPVGFTSANVLTVFGNDTVCHKSSSANSGSFAMKLETIKLSNNFGASIGVPDTVSFAFTGAIVNSGFTYTIKTGYPFYNRPQFMAFYYKYSPAAGDSATAGIVLTKWNSGTGSRDTVATGMKHMGSKGMYSVDSVMLTYTSAYASGGNPDSAFVYFASSNIKRFSINPGGTMTLQYNSTKIGSLLWVDDWFPTSVGVNEINTMKYSAFPVPANDVYTLRFEKSERKTIQVFDLNGKLVDEMSGTEKIMNIKTLNYNPGVYLLCIKDASGNLAATEKFVVIH
jgi:hypothetical protein